MDREDTASVTMGSYRYLTSMSRFMKKSHKSPPEEFSSARAAAMYGKHFLEKASKKRKSRFGPEFSRSPVVVSFIGLLAISCLFQLHLSYVLQSGVGISRDLLSRKNTLSSDISKVGHQNSNRHTNASKTVDEITDKLTNAAAADNPNSSEHVDENPKSRHLRRMPDQYNEVNPILRPIIESGGKFYILNRRDRSGRVVGDMLYAHAFAFANNLTYGGLCWIQGRYKDEIYSLMDDLKWGKVLPLACPKDVDIEKFAKKYSPNEQNATEISPLILNTDVYKIHSNFKHEWVQKISKDLVDQFFMEKEEKLKSQSKTKPFEIAVHVRRGDIEPCKFSSRYLPNSYYLDIIDRYTPDEDELNGRPLKITIYSESDSYESFDEFIERGYTLDLDTPKLGDVWRALSTADVAILSPSHFSVIPAIINPNIVIMPEYSQFEALEGWGLIHVSKQYRKQMTMMHEECMKASGKSR
jgi:hypothetical protein